MFDILQKQTTTIGTKLFLLPFLMLLAPLFATYVFPKGGRSTPNLDEVLQGLYDCMNRFLYFVWKIKHRNIDITTDEIRNLSGLVTGLEHWLRCLKPLFHLCPSSLNFNIDELISLCNKVYQNTQATMYSKKVDIDLVIKLYNSLYPLLKPLNDLIKLRRGI